VRLQGTGGGDGGASGLGLAVAERLVELGARVAVLDLRPPVALPPGAAYVEADVGSEAAADRAMAEAVNVLGGLTLAVNCAGISHRGAGGGQGRVDGADGFRPRRHGQSNRLLKNSIYDAR
jgi:NAD(P)-dependent dehydrogenase (short-subunit alcohol dehydrogenase family)